MSDESLNTKETKKSLKPKAVGIDSLAAFKVEKPLHPVLLVNRYNHPQTISYNGIGMVIPPGGRQKVGNKEMVGALPRGVEMI